MNYDFEDFRPKPPKQDLGKWPFWSSPPELALDYVIKIAIFLLVVPMFFGVQFTPLGLLFNYLFLDLLIYWQYKRVT